MSTLFLQSEIKNPYSLYQKMMDENPVYWDESNKIWAIYSYAFCSEILNHKNLHIPTVSEKDLNGDALEISRNLARLSNGIDHEIAKETAVTLFLHIKSFSINSILSELLKSKNNTIDWVETVCKKLPLLTILKGFHFTDKNILLISQKMTYLIKIMQPNKTINEIELINTTSTEIFLIVGKQCDKLPFYENLVTSVATKYNISKEKAKSVFISNLIGLLIQSYDAGRGLLSNSLLQYFSKENICNMADKIEIEKLVTETLRFDPPIHNTRRIAKEDIIINNVTIKKNATILVVLAAANRDYKQFDNPMIFDIERKNNNQHLTFGTGGHTCLAKHFSVNLTTETLYYLFSNFSNISILDKKTEYQPLINARLPKAIWISISN